MRIIALAAATAAVAALAIPALAQPYGAGQPNDQSLDQLVITGHSRFDEPRTISQEVSFSDLDLTYGPDRAELRQRISSAAREVCNDLNEDAPSPANLGRSCQDVAIRGAMDQMQLAVDDAYAARSYASNDRYGRYYGPR